MRTSDVARNVVFVFGMRRSVLLFFVFELRSTLLFCDAADYFGPEVVRRILGEYKTYLGSWQESTTLQNLALWSSQHVHETCDQLARASHLTPRYEMDFLVCSFYQACIWQILRACSKVRFVMFVVSIWSWKIHLKTWYLPCHFVSFWLKYLYCANDFFGSKFDT